LGAELTISVDAMGGDKAPNMVIKGLKMARKRHPNVNFIIHGDETRILPLMKRAKSLKNCSEIRHTPDIVSNEDKVSHAIRNGRKSSMWNALSSVKAGDAQGAISAGNTGALMAMAKLQLRTLPGIDRPAIAALVPTVHGDSVMLDLGANSECSAENLLQFAVMGEVFARTVLGLHQPSLALLNIGSEDLKGTETLRDAAAALKDEAYGMNFYGFVEGNDIGAGKVDVIVTDGFTGNVALKTAEGTAKLYTQFLKEAFKSSILSKLGYILARTALNKVRFRTDPRRYNGAMFLGLNGIAVKSHGGTDALGFANATSVTVDLIAQGFNDKIKKEFDRISLERKVDPVQNKEAVSA
jgi:glycerol-3-phosphate acyltransferase PlsX